MEASPCTERASRPALHVKALPVGFAHVRARLAGWVLAQFNLLLVVHGWIPEDYITSYTKFSP